MIEYALKNLIRRWQRSLITAAGISIMMTLVIVITGIVQYEVRTMNAHASAGSGKIYVQPILAGSGYPAEGIDLADGLATDILTHTGSFIQDPLSGRVLFFNLRPPLYPNQPAEVILIGIESGREEAFTGSIARNVIPVAGVEFFADSDEEVPAILGEHAAQVLAAETGLPLGPGDSVEILGINRRVIGILEKSSDLVVNNAVILPLADAQQLLEKDDFVSAVILTPRRIADDEAVLGILQTSFPRLTTVTDNTIRNNARDGIRIFEDLVNTISTVVLVCASLLLATVMLITVKERTKEIGVLRALGASKPMIIGSILAEILFLSLAGSTLAGLLSSGILRFGLQENLFDLGHILSILPVSALVALAGGLVPALQISRILPVESLRYE